MEKRLTLPDSVIESFHLMWDHYPEPVSLVHRSREIMAVNKVHYFQPGMNCAKQGGPDAHKGCLANKALDAHKAMFCMVKPNGKEIIAYWLPIDGYPDYYIHFGVGVTIDYRSAGEGQPDSA